MAKVQRFAIVDDMDGAELDVNDFENIQFDVDDKRFEFDTSTKNAGEFRRVQDKAVQARTKAIEAAHAKFDEALAKYVEVSRPVAKRRQYKRTTVPSVRPKYQLDRIRSWARENGYQVSDRGRIAAKIVDAYEAAN